MKVKCECIGQCNHLTFQRGLEKDGETSSDEYSSGDERKKKSSGKARIKLGKSFGKKGGKAAKKVKKAASSSESGEESKDSDSGSGSDWH